MTPGLRWTHLVADAARSVRAQALRSALTALGVIIGVAAVVVLTALGRGSADAVLAEFKRFGTNLLTVSPKAGTASRLTGSDAAEIERRFAARVRGVAATQQRGVNARSRQFAANATAVGTTGAYAALRHAHPASGRFFTDAENRRRARVAVLGHGVASALFGRASPLGKRVRLDGVPFEVVGVLPDKGDGGLLGANHSVFVPLATLQQRLGRPDASGPPTVDGLTIGAASEADLPALAAAVTALLRARHGTRVGQEADFEVFDQTEALKAAGNVNASFVRLLAGVAGISLLVGGIGIMNIMLVNVTERTREIGLRRAIGATPAEILGQFLVEAVVLSVGGAALGAAFGVAGALLSGPVFGAPARLSPDSLVLSFGVASAVGLVFGLYPAARAARLDPVEALRYE